MDIRVLLISILVIVFLMNIVSGEIPVITPPDLISIGNQTHDYPSHNVELDNSVIQQKQYQSTTITNKEPTVSRSLKEEHIPITHTNNFSASGYYGIWWVSPDPVYPEIVKIEIAGLNFGSIDNMILYAGGQEIYGTNLEVSPPNGVYRNYYLITADFDLRSVLPGTYTISTGGLSSSLTIRNPNLPELFSIDPYTGKNTATIQAVIEGSHFQDGLSMSLTRDGNPAISGSNIKINTERNQVTCTFSLIGVNQGLWNLTACNPGGYCETLPEEFEITDPNMPLFEKMTPNSSYNTESPFITITGANFQNGVTVKLITNDGLSISATNIKISTDKKKITCTLPLSGASTGLYSVQIINPNNKLVQINDAFKIMVLPGIDEYAYAYSWTVLSPSELAIDNAGNIYTIHEVLDSSGIFTNTYLEKFDNKGTSLFKKSINQYFPPSIAGTPSGMTVDKEMNIYISSYWENVIIKFGPDGKYITQLNTIREGTGSEGIGGIVTDNLNNLYAIDQETETVQKFSKNGIYIGQWKITSPNTDDGIAVELYDIAIDSDGKFYICDLGQGRILKYDSDGSYLTEWKYNEDPNWRLLPSAIAIDTSNDIYISTYSNDYGILKFDRNGTFISKWCPYGPFLDELLYPDGVEVDSSGRVYVLDRLYDDNNGYVKVFQNPTPKIISLSPQSSPNTGPLSVIITGENFRSGANIILSNNTLKIPGTVTSLTSNKIVSTLQLNGAPTCIWDLEITNPGGYLKKMTHAFTVTNSSPVITAVSPATGFNTTNTNLTITGSSFRNGISAKLICDNFTLDGTNLVKTDTAKVQYTFETLGQSAGKYNLTLTNIDGSTVTKPSAFELKSPSDSPVITATNPWTGANNAAKAIIITGSNFRGPTTKTFTGITVTLTNTTFGATITGTPTSKKTQSATILYYTLPLTGQPAGIYDLTVRNYDGSTVTNTSGFIITTTNPTVTKISPVSGYTTKDQPVTLTGTNYRTGASVVMTNGSISYNGSGVTVASPTTLTCTLGLLTDSVQPGGYNLTITNTDGTSGTLANAFTVIAPVNSPVISSITPVYGTNNIALPVTITGSNFRTPSVSITNSTACYAATAMKKKKQSATVLYYTLPLIGLEPGSYEVKVTNADGTYATFPFTVNPTTPTVTTISPAFGYTNGDTAVTITGTNYREGATVNLTNSTGTYCATNTIISPTKITCTLPTSQKTAGKYNLTVTNKDETNVTKPDSFTVYNPGNLPNITAISPNVSTNAESKAVTILGSDFRGTSAKSFAGIAVTLSNTTTSTTVTGTPTPKKAQSATRLYYTLPFSGVPAGVYDLKVANADGEYATYPEAVTVTTTQPSIAIDPKTKKEKISPLTAFNTSNVSVTITGNNFREGVSVVLENGTEIQGTVTTRLINQVITTFPLNGKDAGSYNLTITNTDGTSVTAKTKFSVTNPGTAAVISSVSPASAFNTGNQPVEISGTNFNKPTVYLNQRDLTMLAIATAKKKSTATTLYVTFPLKDIPGGLYSIIVRNSDGVNTTATDIFYVTEKAWVNSVQKSPVVQSNPRMPVMSLPQVSRPAGNQAKIVGPQIINSPVVVPPVPVVGRG